jgi:hypothetical protein
MIQENPKIQTPKSKKMPRLKVQNEFHWDLEFGVFLGFGIWSLGFFSVFDSWSLELA